MKYLIRLLLIGVVAVPCSGCAFRTGDLSVVSSQNVGLQTDVIRRGVEGSDCVDSILFIPLGSLRPNLDEAMDRALEKVPDGNILTDIAIYNDMISTAIYNRICLRVKGDVGRLK